MDQRPKTRGDCIDGPRPCPWVSCRHHLYLDVSEAGRITQNFDGEPEDMPESCSLDVADRGGLTHEEVGALFGVSRQCAQEMEVRALAHPHIRRRLAIFEGHDGSLDPVGVAVHNGLGLVS